MRQVVVVGGRERRIGGAKQCRMFSEKRKQRSRGGNKLKKLKTGKYIEGKEMRLRGL